MEETTKINAEDVLEVCFKLIQEARGKACKGRYRTDSHLHIVLPVLQDRAICYYLARDPSKQMSVTGTIDFYDRNLFGATRLTSEIIEEPIVY